MALPGQTAPDHHSFQHVERGKQCCGIVSDVIVGLPGGYPQVQRQHGLSSAQGLDLAFFIHRQKQSLVRRVQIQPHDIPQLAHESGVPAQLGSFGSMRLQAVRPPDAPHRGLAHPLRARQSAGTPVRGISRARVQRGVHDGLHLPSPDALSTPRPGGIPQQPCDARLHVALTPQQNRWARDAQLFRKAMVRNPFGRSQNDPCPEGHFL